MRMESGLHFPGQVIKGVIDFVFDQACKGVNHFNTLLCNLLAIKKDSQNTKM